MSTDANLPAAGFCDIGPTGESLSQFIVPGTSVVAGATVPSAIATPRHACRANRDPHLRRLYADHALARVPHLLSMTDCNPYRPTYGCMDRAYWHYRTSDFPSQMYQEGVWPLALIYTVPLPGNRWHANPRIRELSIAGMRFCARSSHGDGSCDDYYPYERALGAAAFSLLAAVRAYRLLELDDTEILDWILRRATWLADHDESGRLTNHHATIALALAHVWQLTEESRFAEAADREARRVHAWQSPEGWFDEYGGADPGYQTVTIDALVKYRRLTESSWLDEPLLRAVRFAHWFLHPDGSYGGPYGSRGTRHFYPHGFELLSDSVAAAADLADGFLRSLRGGTVAYFDDDRMFVHRLGNLIEAYRDWSPERPVSDLPATEETKYFPRAQILIDRDGASRTVISAARGGVFTHTPRDAPAVSDAGLLVETVDGRVAASQVFCSDRKVRFTIRPAPEGLESVPQPENAQPGPSKATPDEDASTGEVHAERACWQLTVEGPLYWTRFELATPLRAVALRLGMLTVGRWLRDHVRRFLQRRVVTGLNEAPIALSRRITRIDGRSGEAGCLRVEDTIELHDSRIEVRRLSFGADHEVRYTAAANIYQQSTLQPWYDLSQQDVEELNRRRRLRVAREFEL